MDQFAGFFVTFLVWSETSRMSSDVVHICSPSRAAMLTGRLPNLLGHVSHDNFISSSFAFSECVVLPSLNGKKSRDKLS